MEVLDNTYEPFVSTKRQLAAIDDRELEDIVESRRTVSNFPPPKVRNGVQVVRDFPSGCGIKLERRPLENLDNQNLCENITSNGIKKFKGSTPIENIEYKCYNPKKLEQTKSNCSRPSGKVKCLELPCLKKGYTLKPKVTTTVFISRRKPIRNLDIADIKLEKITSNGNPKSMDASRYRGISKLKNSIPKEIHGRLYGELLDPNSLMFEPFVDKKRLFDDTDNDCMHDDFSEDGYGKKLKVMKPSMSSDNLGIKLGKMKSYGNDKSTESQEGENNKFKKFKPKERVKKKPYLASRPPSKVKPWDPTSLKKSITILSREEVVQRGKIKDLIDLFNDLYDQKSLEDKSVHWKTAQHEVARIVKQKLKWIEPEKVLGSVCGVRIGDKFRFRLQIHMIGVHRQLEPGIDYTEINGKNLAISIVDSHRYLNESRSSDMLIYSGHGGIGSWGCNVPIKDQKLEKGNLALKNSMDEKNPIRVIRKVEVGGKSDVFLYDGFYYVNHYTEKLNNAGKIEFRFKLSRLPGQPESSINSQC